MNDPSTSPGPVAAPAESRRRSRGLVFRLYTSNPFYVLSADLVFVGLRMSFDTHGKTFETWALMLGLAGYTLLLALTACWLIRTGKVWDDVRSLLLLVVMLFLAMSVTFDDTLAGHPGRGAALYLVGLIFAIAVSEGLLRGIRLELPYWFRASYYLILSLFFVYPVALSPLLSAPESPRLQWALFGFSPVAGLVFLSLLPAIRKGPGYVRENGSPWRWPLYPWVLYGLLALGVCARAFYLCVSLHFVDRTLNEPTNSIFGLYFLVPFLFCVNILLLEIGLVARNRAVVRVALLVPLGLLALSLAEHRPDIVYQRFLAIFTAGLGGSPLFLTLIAATVFYLFAMARSVPLASGALAVSLAAFTVVGPETYNLDSLLAPRPWPILLVASLEFGRAYLDRDVRRLLSGSVCLVTALVMGLPADWSTFSRTVVAAHLAIFAMLGIAAWLDNALGRLLERVSALLLLFLGCAATVIDPARFPSLPNEVWQAYPLAAIALAAGYGWILRNRLFLGESAIALACWLGVNGGRGYLILRQRLAGLDMIAWGLFFFVLAAAISMRKAGVFPRRLAWKPPESEL